MSNSKESRKGEKEEHRIDGDKQKAMSEMAQLNPNISIMTLNVNRLNSPHKNNYQPK